MLHQKELVEAQSVQRVRAYRCACLSYGDSLPPQPALGRVAPPLEHDGVALQPGGHVVPRTHHELVLSLKGGDLLLEFGLQKQIKSVSGQEKA